MSGHFIAFEGGEGSGKSTQARRLAERLGPQALLTFEPGDSPLGAEVRRLVLDSPDLDITDRAEALLMAADRAQHVAEVIEPALDAGRTVICDRFAGSSIAYQGHGRQLPGRRGGASVAVGDPGALARPRGAARAEPGGRRVAPPPHEGPARVRRRRRSTGACTTATSCRRWRTRTAGPSSTAPAPRTRSPRRSGRSSPSGSPTSADARGSRDGNGDRDRRVGRRRRSAARHRPADRRRGAPGPLVPAGRAVGLGEARPPPGRSRRSCSPPAAMARRPSGTSASPLPSCTPISTSSRPPPRRDASTRRPRRRSSSRPPSRRPREPEGPRARGLPPHRPVRRDPPQVRRGAAAVDVLRDPRRGRAAGAGDDRQPLRAHRPRSGAAART